MYMVEYWYISTGVPSSVMADMKLANSDRATGPVCNKYVHELGENSPKDQITMASVYEEQIAFIF